MDGCELNDAFPTGPYGSPGCQDRASAEESRRQEKKKARKCRGPQATYLDNGWNMVGAVDADPDRQSFKPLPPVPALNTSTGLTEHAPVTQQYNYESFVGGMDSLPAIRKDVSGPNALQKTKDVPNFFGASPSDEPTTSLMSKRGLTEAFQSDSAPFVNVIGTEESYKLMPDFEKTFGKASTGSIPSGPSPVAKEDNYLTPTSMLPNSILPVPNVDVFWKEHTGLAGGQSSFFGKLKYPGGYPSGEAEMVSNEDVPASRREVLTKLDKIFARLDDMDAAKSENAQTEILLFIMTGLGVIFLMDIGCRAAMRR
jgi:hypothetical protein